MIGDLLAFIEGGTRHERESHELVVANDEDPEIAKRFFEAQYKRARISYDLMIDESGIGQLDRR
jgi:hypothetical protein